MEAPQSRGHLLRRAMFQYSVEQPIRRFRNERILDPGYLKLEAGRMEAPSLPRLLEHRGRTDPNYLEATQRFSAKDWRTVAWTDDQIDKQEVDTKTVRG